MTKPPYPSNENPNSQIEVQSEEDLPFDIENQDSEEDEGDEGKSGEGGGQRPNLEEDDDVDFFVDYRLKPDLSEKDALLEQMRKLVKAPSSRLVEGASAFASENELSRRIYMGRIGIVTNHILPKQVSEDAFFEDLEQRQRDQIEREGIPHPDDDAIEGSDGIETALALMSVSLADTDKKPQDKSKSSDRKNKAKTVEQQRKIVEEDDGRDFYKPDVPSSAAATAAQSAAHKTATAAQFTKVQSTSGKAVSAVDVNLLRDSVYGEDDFAEEVSDEPEDKKDNRSEFKASFDSADKNAQSVDKTKANTGPSQNNPTGPRGLNR